MQLHFAYRYIFKLVIASMFLSCNMVCSAVFTGQMSFPLGIVEVLYCLRMVFLSCFYSERSFNAVALADIKLGFLNILVYTQDRCCGLQDEFDLRATLLLCLFPVLFISYYKREIIVGLLLCFSVCNGSLCL